MRIGDIIIIVVVLIFVSILLNLVISVDFFLIFNCFTFFNSSLNIYFSTPMQLCIGNCFYAILYIFIFKIKRETDYDVLTRTTISQILN